MSNAQLRVEPAELISAAGDLDKIAERLELALAGAQGALSVPAQGRDEVSVASAASFTTVAEKFEKDTATGVLELRKIAATLRAQASGLIDSDSAAAAAFRIQA
ncbi:PE family protein [Gordonia westfalica]|uniref:PE family protein n=1 Tax=Gordonia westfalica TaxID=158898 RepID=A0ABU2GSB5_9ACTN|nr:PE family protein [Gordonia westfalica]MDS1113967.1 PE family protein [Gordonia westfalica]